LRSSVLRADLRLRSGQSSMSFSTTSEFSLQRLAAKPLIRSTAPSRSDLRTCRGAPESAANPKAHSGDGDNHPPAVRRPKECRSSPHEETRPPGRLRRGIASVSIEHSQGHRRTDFQSSVSAPTDERASSPNSSLTLRKRSEPDERRPQTTNRSWRISDSRCWALAASSPRVRPKPGRR